MQPPFLVVGKAQQRLDLPTDIGWHFGARVAAHVEDPPQALSEPCFPAAPFERGHQDFDCSSE
jgi:hypothetical protein